MPRSSDLKNLEIKTRNRTKKEIKHLQIEDCVLRAAKATDLRWTRGISLKQIKWYKARIKTLKGLLEINRKHQSQAEYWKGVAESYSSKLVKANDYIALLTAVNKSNKFEQELDLMARKMPEGSMC